MPRVAVDGDATFERSANISFLWRAIIRIYKTREVRSYVTNPHALVGIMSYYYDLGMFGSPLDIKENVH